MTINSTITPELLDQLLANYEKPEDLTGEGGAFQAAQESVNRTRARRRADGALGLREGRSCRSRQRQQPQRLKREDSSDPRWRDRDCGAARPGRQLRAAADRQGPDPLRWVRRENPEPVRARHDGARDPGPPG